MQGCTSKTVLAKNSTFNIMAFSTSVYCLKGWKLKNNEYRFAIGGLAAKGPNKSIEINGDLDIQNNYQSSVLCSKLPELSSLPDFVNIQNSIINYTSILNELVIVKVSRFTWGSESDNISSITVACKLQLVMVNRIDMV